MNASAIIFAALIANTATDETAADLSIVQAVNNASIDLKSLGLASDERRNWAARIVRYASKCGVTAWADDRCNVVTVSNPA